MKRLLLATTLAALVASGCAKKNSSDETDFMAEDAELADTASVEDAPVPEAQDAQPTDTQGSQPVETAQDTGAAASPPPAEGTWTQQPETAATAPASTYGTGQIEQYTVRQGDTLMKVAFNIYGDIDAWKQLYEMNRDTLKSAGSLRAGQSLKYDKPVSAPVISQNGEPYLIHKGDTLGTISNEVYATTKKWRKLWENNRELIKDPNRIYAGFYLYYQITEEEKRMAEQRRAAPAQAAAVATPSTLEAAPAPVSTTATNAAPAEAAPANRDPAATQ